MESVGKAPARLSRTDPATQAEWVALPAPLRECGEIAGVRLSGMLSDALRQAEDLLFLASTQALTRGECEAILDAAEFARARRASLLQDFLKHFEKRYVRACQYKPRLISAYRIDFDSSQLQIVPHDLLDDSLDPGMIAEAIQNSSWGSLNDLTRCFGKLLGAEAIKLVDMPLSPNLIEAAVSDAIRDQPRRHDAKCRLARSLRRGLPDRVGPLYRDLADYLSASPHQADEEVADSSASSDQTKHGPVMPLPVQDGETSNRASKVVKPEEIVELAMQVARETVARRQVEMPPPLASGEGFGLSAGMPALPDTGVATEPGEAMQASAPARSPASNPQTEPIKAAVPLAELKHGDWLEFRQVNGRLSTLKLSWISPHKSLYLMTDLEGERALSMVAEALAAALQDGSARLIRPRQTQTRTSAAAATHLPRKKTA